MRKVIVISLLAFVLMVPSLAYSQESQEKIIESPLSQYKSGVFPEDIQCKEGFDLIFKPRSGWIPACVKPDTAEKLLERGWTTMIVISSSSTMTIISSSKT